VARISDVSALCDSARWRRIRVETQGVAWAPLQRRHEMNRKGIALVEWREQACQGGCESAVAEIELRTGGRKQTLSQRGNSCQVLGVRVSVME
jgi:hypothetical protein